MPTQEEIALTAERDQLAKQNRDLVQQNEQRVLQGELETKLRTRLTDAAAADVAIQILSKVKVDGQGRLVDSDYNIGTDAIIDAFLESRPHFRINGARDGGASSPEAKDPNETFDALLAKDDGAYLAEWEKKNPEVVDREWNKMIAGMREERRKNKR